MKVLIRAVKPHPYDGIERAVGAEYEADHEFVAALEASGLAVRADQYQTRDMAAAPAAGYQTRDTTLHARKRTKGH